MSTGSNPGQPGGWIIDDPVAAVFKVNRAAFTSQEVLDLERERIFDRAWLYLGHEQRGRSRIDLQSQSQG